MLQRQKGLPPFMPEFAVLSGGLRSETTADDLKTTHLGEIFCSDFVIFQADDFFNIRMYLALVAAWYAGLFGSNTSPAGNSHVLVSGCLSPFALLETGCLSLFLSYVRPALLVCTGVWCGLGLAP